MKKSNSATGISIEDLFYDILIRIFLKLNVVELSIASMVCKSWNEICRNPLLWAKLDLSRLSSNAFHNIPLLPDVSKDKFMKFLKYTLRLSNHNTRFLMFECFYLYLRDAELIFVAERTPNLRRLVMPLNGRLSMNGISAMKLWDGLESITITDIVDPRLIFSAISKYWKNISEMKITSKVDISEADLMVKYTPNLKLLSIRYVMVNLKSLCNILNSLEKLELVNICHSFIWDRVEGVVVVYTVCDLRNHLSLSCLQKLVFCNGRRCLSCRNKNDPFEVFEDWREDEIRSLAR